MNLSSFVSTNQFNAVANRWTKLLDTETGVAAVFPHISDRLMRIQQFIQQIVNENWAFVVQYEPSLLHNESLIEFTQNINYLATGNPDTDVFAHIGFDKKLVIVIPNGDRLIEPQQRHTMELLQTYLSVHPKKVSVLAAYEVNISHAFPEYYKYNLLFQNLDYYPLYNNGDSEIFIKYLMKDWSINNTKKLKQSIIAECGGSFWLIKQAMRVIRDYGSWNVDHPTNIERVVQIVNSMSEEEQKLVALVPKLPELYDSSSLLHLKKIGLITEDLKVKIPLLKQMCEQKLRTVNLIQVSDHMIRYKNVDVTSIFSHHEQVLLKKFINSAGTSVTREEIGETLWGNDVNSNFSPWAIDQSIKRLRDKLVKLGLPGSLIRSVRGIGYVYRT